MKEKWVLSHWEKEVCDDQEVELAAKETATEHKMSGCKNERAMKIRNSRMTR